MEQKQKRYLYRKRIGHYAYRLRRVHAQLLILPHGHAEACRNLSSSELVGQILIAFDELSAWPSAQIGRPLTNIVLMGMGEPLYNLDNVIKALKIIMDNEGISISKRRITLSGIVPEFSRCGLETDVNLAISLHAVTDDVRDILVPINKKYPIKDLLDACREYPGVSNSRRITFEYVMLKGINDSTSDAKALIKLMEGIPAKINLILLIHGLDHRMNALRKIK